MPNRQTGEQGSVVTIGSGSIGGIDYELEMYSNVFIMQLFREGADHLLYSLYVTILEKNDKISTRFVHYEYNHILRYCRHCNGTHCHYDQSQDGDMVEVLGLVRPALVDGLSRALLKVALREMPIKVTKRAFGSRDDDTRHPHLRVPDRNVAGAVYMAIGAALGRSERIMGIVKKAICRT